MNCRSCGAKIADKAIVCYRCGAPTAEPVRREAPRPRRQGAWIAAPLIVAIILLAVWLIPQTEPGSTERIAAWVATWLVAFGVVAWVKRRRR
jgi:hypothetical protein